jgi:hypothetical protein
VKRRLFNLATAVSLMLCAAIIVLWVRSYRSLNSLSAADGINFTHTDPLYWIISRPGHAILCRQTGHDWSGHELHGFHFIGVRFGGLQAPDGSMLWNLELPYWLLTASALLLPVVRAEIWRRERMRLRRRNLGQCPSCGYDLRATSERCPECGWSSAQ